MRTIPEKFNFLYFAKKVRAFRYILQGKTANVHRNGNPKLYKMPRDEFATFGKYIEILLIVFSKSQIFI